MRTKTVHAFVHNIPVHKKGRPKPAARRAPKSSWLDRSEGFLNALHKLAVGLAATLQIINRGCQYMGAPLRAHEAVVFEDCGGIFVLMHLVGLQADEASRFAKKTFRLRVLLCVAKRLGGGLSGN